MTPQVKAYIEGLIKRHPGLATGMDILVTILNQTPRPVSPQHMREMKDFWINWPAMKRAEIEAEGLKRGGNGGPGELVRESHVLDVLYPSVPFVLETPKGAA